MGARMSAEDWKRQAAENALKDVEPGMKLGLGTGSTAAKFVDLLGAKVKAGLDVVCVPTSEATRAQAAALGIRLSTLDETPFLDLTVDGADELDSELRLIKGGGGALLPITPSASRRWANFRYRLKWSSSASRQRRT
jgi:ribose 5-phosphate isomerase A